MGIKNRDKLVTILFFIISLNLSLFTIEAYASSEKKNSNLTTTNEDPSIPDIVGKSALTMDANTGEVILSKDANKKVYPASITKLMTALLLAEHAKPTDVVALTDEAKKQPPYSLSSNYGPLEVGDSLSGEEVMDALLLYSANDSAYMVADFISGSGDEFIKLMNKKAKELGMNDTNFVTANGLHSDNHYTTPYNLALLGKAAYSNQWIQKSLSKKYSSIEFDKSKKKIILYTTNKTLGENGNIGGKTGFTSQAGRCLLNIYKKGDKTLIGVVLDSDRGTDDSIVFKDMDTIMDYSFTAKKVPFKKADETIDKIKLTYKAFGVFGKEREVTIPITLKENVTYYNNSFNNSTAKLEFNTDKLNPWTLASNPEIKINLKEISKTTSYTAIAGISLSTLLKSNALYYLITVGGTLATIFIIIFGIRRMNMNKRRKRIFNRKNRKIYK